MIIKRKEYKRLQQIAQTRLRLLAIDDGAQIINITMESLAYGAADHFQFRGAFRLETICPETIATTSAATPPAGQGYAINAEVERALTVLRSRLTGETTTENGTTDDA
jgi:hypothetical protein